MESIRFSLTRLQPPVVVSVILLMAFSASASDWPAYRHDARRSATSTDSLDFPLRLAWHRKSKLRPRPAFADPLKHPSGIDFAYVRDHSEPVLLDFDHAFHPVAAAGRVFFGSSADDGVRCLSLATGRQQWVFITGGPVRFAPQVVGDRLIVASDDGFVYCLAVESGKLVWQFLAAPSARQLVGNGRMISRWPLRTGVLAMDGTVYVTAGMWPAEGIFVYALDMATGAVKWVNDTSGTLNQPTANPGAYAITGVAPTGYLLAGKGALVVPTGRSIPASYSLKDGRLLASVAPSYQNRRGGPAVCIDPHGSVIFGYPRERLTGTAYGIHRVYRLPLMQQYSDIRGDQVIVDDKTFVAVNDLIRCYKADARYRKVTVQWQDDCPSKSVHCMALAANALLLGMDNRVVARDRATGKVLWQRDDLDGHVQSLAVANSRILVATDAGSIYCFANFVGSSPHDGLLGPSQTRSIGTATNLRGHRTLRNALEGGRIRRGLALVIGQRDTSLAAQLAAATRLQVVLLLDGADAVMAARRELLQQADPEHGQVSVQQHIRDKPLPFADYAFNVIAATGEAAIGRAAELLRVLRPAGGVLYVDNLTPQVEATLRVNGVSAPELRKIDNALVYRRGKLAGALDWDSETNTDLRVKWPLELLWFGGPGSKRTGGGSRAPVAAGGRNLVIGKNHLIALDAYNGTELWSRTLPYLYRNIGRLRNAPGPISPWLTQSVSADDEHAYLNFGHVVYTLDAATGEQQAVHGKLPAAKQFLLKDQPRFTLEYYQKPVDVGIGPAHPKTSVTVKENGRRMVLTIAIKDLAKLGGAVLDDFSFAAALNHPAGADQKTMAGRRGYLRWEVHADAFAYAFNNGWPRIIRRGASAARPIQLPAISELPQRALRAGRIGRVGKRAGYVVNVNKDRKNPLSLEVCDFQYHRGKGCGNPVSAGSLQVLRSGTLAFYDLDDDSGMRYFGGVRPSCTVSAVPAQGLVFAAEGSSGCSCNYNFKTTLALAPAKQRRHEDWAMFTAPLGPGALLRTGRFNLGAPGDRRDNDGWLWLQYPRAPTYSNRTMPVPVELLGKTLRPYRVNADRVAIAGTDRPWLYTSGYEGIEGLRLQLFMSDKDGVVVFPTTHPPKLDAALEDSAWERRYAVPAGAGGLMFISHDKEVLYVGYEIVPPVDRRGKRQPWKTRGGLPHSVRFTFDDKADDAAVWDEDSLEFLISDASLKTILHFGVGVTGGRYDGLWSMAKKKEDAAYAGRWSGAIEVTNEKAVAELAFPWKTLKDAGLDLENLVIRPRFKRPIARQPHITHGFRPLLVQANKPKTKHYRVVLHFAELSDAAPGERIFDIQIQGKTVLKSFDPIAVAGGPKRAVVRVFERILANRALDIRFVSDADDSTKPRPPILSAVEVLLDN